MKIAIISDVHDHLDKLEKVLEKIVGVDAIIFCGDMVSPFMTGVFAKAGKTTYAIPGNNDEDQIGMVKMGGEKFTWFHLSQEFGSITLEQRKIAFCHYPKLAELLAKSGEYDAVFYGHTHKAANSTVGRTLLLNPGAVCGIDLGKSVYGKSSFAIYDTSANTAEIIEI